MKTIKAQVDKPLIYLLFDKTELVFVGSSRVDIFNAAAKAKKLQHDSFRLMFCAPARIDYWKRVLIKRFSPKHNKQIYPPANGPKIMKWRTITISQKFSESASEFYRRYHRLKHHLNEFERKNQFIPFSKIEIEELSNIEIEER